MAITVIGVNFVKILTYCEIHNGILKSINNIFLDFSATVQITWKPYSILNHVKTDLF